MSGQMKYRVHGEQVEQAWDNFRKLTQTHLFWDFLCLPYTRHWEMPYVIFKQEASIHKVELLTSPHYRALLIAHLVSTPVEEQTSPKLYADLLNMLMEAKK